MALEQYIVRELKRDIKYLIQKVADLEQKIDELHLKVIRSGLKLTQKSYTLSHDASGDVYTESKKMQDELEPIDDSKTDETFKRYAGYREWNKTHDSYKILYSPHGQDEYGKKIKDD